MHGRNSATSLQYHVCTVYLHIGILSYCVILCWCCECENWVMGLPSCLTCWSLSTSLSDMISFLCGNSYFKHQKHGYDDWRTTVTIHFGIQRWRSYWHILSLFECIWILSMVFSEPGRMSRELMSYIALVSASVAWTKNFNVGHNLLTRIDRAFILHMCIPCDKTLHLVP